MKLPCFRVNIPSLSPIMGPVNSWGCNTDSSGDPDEQAHPVVNSAPQRRRSPVEGGSTHVVSSYGLEPGHHIPLMIASLSQHTEDMTPSRPRTQPRRLRPASVCPAFAQVLLFAIFRRAEPL